LQPEDVLVLLDERGKEFGSIDFSKFIAQKQNASVKRLVFLIGGPFGFDDSIYVRANFKISLSKMTFSHQMVRLFFVEQLYRAFTILKGEKYHHE
jgi:23S rRNA (pseudouridine1915-N3)-methyltransferase